MSVTSLIRVLSIILVITGVFGAPSCSSAEITVGKYRCSSLTSYFYGDSMKVRVARFAAADVEKRYAIYICGNQFIEPPATYLADPFAQEGVKVVGFLKSKLLQARDDGSIRDIVNIFSAMRRQHAYDVAMDAELMQVIRASASGMRDPYWKQFVEREIAEIVAPFP